LSAGHTPGPWRAEYRWWPGGGTVYRDDGCFSILDNNGNVVCSRTPWAERADELRANAQLISAAPELFMALSECVLFVEEYWRSMGLEPNSCPAIVQTHAILTKARGEE
jgi:hypothetical protein